MPDFAEFQINGAQVGGIGGASSAVAFITEEVSEPMEVNNLTATATSTSTAVALDLTKNGTSVFGTATSLGTIYAGASAQTATGGIGTTDTTVDIVPTGKPIEAPCVLAIESENVVVTKVSGSPNQAPTGVGVQRLTITRAANGTSAAAHAASVAVYAVKPTIASGGTATPSYGFPVPIPFAVGDILAVVGATGAVNLSATLDCIRV